MSVREEIKELWLRQTEMSSGKIWLSSMVRICRNLQGYIFPARASHEARQKISSIILNALGHMMRPKKDWVVLPWNSCSESERRILKRLCYLDFPCEETLIIFGKGKQELFIVNDGDALRIQCLASGSELNSLWKNVSRIDCKLQNYLPYAFDPAKGYATSSPAKCGNGMDIRALVHIPALCFKQQLGQIQESLKTLQLKMDAAEVLGDKILGHKFFITNSVAQGCSEEDLLKHVGRVVQDVIHQEEQSRNQLWKDNENFIKDSISRAIGVLKSCYELTFEEGVNLISVVLMGIDMGIIPNDKRNDLTALWGLMPNDYLREFCVKAFDTYSENEVRANAVHTYFEGYDDRLKEADYVS